MTKQELMEQAGRERQQLLEEIALLPPWHKHLVVRCPKRNRDGSPIDDNDIPGCGSADVEWSGDVYDCNACGIYFADYAADPPHRRQEPAQAEAS